MAKPPKINPPVFSGVAKPKTVHRKTPRGSSMSGELKASANRLGNRIKSGLSTAGKVAGAAMLGRQQIKDTLSSRKTDDVVRIVKKLTAAKRRSLLSLKAHR